MKVDIDSRPDLAERYGDYGWPATVLFSPDAAEIGKYRGYIAPEELAAGHALRPAKPLDRKLTLDAVPGSMMRSSFFRQQQGPARFKPGDRVRTRNMNPPTHTRLPRYARDKLGVVELIHGCHAYPDSVATDRGDDPQWLYTVVFDGREIWGADADPTLKISIDAFEPYLGPA